MHCKTMSMVLVLTYFIFSCFKLSGNIRLSIGKFANRWGWSDYLIIIAEHVPGNKRNFVQQITIF